VLGAAWIAGRAVLPAIAASRNGRLVALASRDRARAERMAAAAGVPRVHASYDALLADPEVEAVYVPLANSLHREWTLRSLAAGKHVLCEKPLALDAAEAEEMAAAADASGLKLMEAFMYRFHPRMRRLRDSLPRALAVHAAFGFPIDLASGSYRLARELGGGALLDVGCYCVDVARWLTGEEPGAVSAVARPGGGEAVEMSLAAALAFPGGALATLWASFESPEHQSLEVVTEEGPIRLEKPFTAWRDPDDPYQLMAEAFADAVLRDGETPLPLSSSVANLRVLDAIRASAGLPAMR
jgi:D-xylose 1-dehydrogenase (NADP+, D-xylono-1,5-lactone-forming)